MSKFTGTSRQDLRQQQQKLLQRIKEGKLTPAQPTTWAWANQRISDIGFELLARDLERVGA